MKYVSKFISILGELFNSMNDQVIVTDPEGNFIFANTTFYTNSGFEQNELKKYFDAVLSAKVISEIQKLLHQNPIIEKSIVITTKSGKKIKGNAAFFLLYHPDAKEFGMMIIMHDETNDEKKIKAKLLQNAFWKVMNFRSDAVWYTSDIINRRILFISDSIKSILGWEPAEFLAGGWTFFLTLIHPDDLVSLITAHVKWLHEKNTIGPMIEHIPFLYSARMRAKDYSYVRMDIESNVQERKEDQVKLIFGSYKPVRKNSETEIDATYIRQIDGKTFIDVNFLKDLKKKTEEKANHNHIELSAREQQIVKLMADGHSSDSIAKKLHISIHTVNMYRKHILKKFDAKNPAELIKKYISMGLSDF